MAAQLITIAICARCLDGDGDCHDKQCTFWQTTPLAADQSAALERQRQVYRDVRGVIWLGDIG